MKTKFLLLVFTSLIAVSVKAESCKLFFKDCEVTSGVRALVENKDFVQFSKNDENACQASFVYQHRPFSALMRYVPEKKKMYVGIVRNDTPLSGENKILLSTYFTIAREAPSFSLSNENIDFSCDMVE